MRKTINKLTAALLAALCMTSCERRPLDVLATSLTINHIPDYSMPFVKPSQTPEHYRVNMYDAATGKLVYKDFVVTGGGPIKSEPGQFVCFMCDFDEGKMILTGESDAGTITITAPIADSRTTSTFNSCVTKATSARLNGSERGIDTPFVSMPVMSAPDCFWVGTTDAEVPRLAEEEDDFVITVRTASAVRQGYVKMTDIEGSENIANIECFVTNLLSGENPITGQLTEEIVAESFFVRPGDGFAEGVFNYFGIAKTGEPRLIYAVVTDTAGGKYLYVYEIEPTEDERGLVFTFDSKMDIPAPEHGGGGFKPELEDWDVEFVDVPLGQGK